MMYRILSFVLCLLITGQIYSKPVTPGAALKQARCFIGSRLAKSKMSAGGSELRLERADKGGAGFYVFDIAGDRGYVIVSADDKAEPILGYVPYGKWQPENLPENMKHWLGGYSKDIRAIQNLRGDKFYSTNSKRPVRKPVNPLITCKWNQGDPYNRMTPDFGDGHGHRPTGCVATALAQVLYYHKWPQGEIDPIPEYKYVDYAISGGDDKLHKIEALPAVTFDWDAMTDEYDEYSDEKSCDAVALLMRYCGQAVRMMYGPYVSGAMSFDLPEALVKYLGYDKGARYVDRDEYTTSQWEQLVYDEVAAGRPVLYSGATVRNEGHQFVCDGYDDGFFHINWGWGGVSDGFFRLSVLDPGTQGTGGATSGLNFSEGQQIIVGVCRPREGSEEPWQGPSVSYVHLNNESNMFHKDGTGKVKGISVYSHIAYSKVKDCSYDVAYGIFDSEDKLIRIVHKNKLAFIAGCNDKRHDYSASLRLLKDDIAADGDYSIRILCKETENEEWMPMKNSSEKCLRVNVSGNDVKIWAVPEIKINIKDINVCGEPFVENMLTITALVNNVESDVESDLYLCVNGKLTSIYTNLDLAKGRSEKIRVPLIFTTKSYYDKTLEIPYEDLNDGVAEMSFYLDGRKVSDVFKIDVRNTTMTFSNLNIDMIESYVSKGDSLVIPVTVTNKSKKPFENVVKCILAEKKPTGKYYYLSESTELFSLQSGEKTDAVFKFDELMLNKDYYIYFILYSYGNEVLYPDDEPVYFGPYTTPDALIYWDSFGEQSYMVSAEDGSYELPSGTCAVKLPQHIDKANVPVSDNKNCVYYFAQQSEVPENLHDGNIVVGSKAEKVMISGDAPFYAPETFRAGHAELIYPEEVVAKKTLILPFVPSQEIGMKIASYSEESEDSLWFEIEEIPRYCIPYIINEENEGDIVFTADDVDVNGRCPVTAGDIHTVYATMTNCISDGSMYMYDGKDFVLTENGSIIPPFSMYMRSMTGADKIGVSLPEDFVTSGISIMNIEEPSCMIYTLDGVAAGKNIDELPDGIYIMKGRKIVK